MRLILAFLAIMGLTTSAASQPISELVDSLMDGKSGSVLVRLDSQDVVMKSYGFSDFESQTPSTPETNYRLASLTKAFTAFGILRLVNDGRLALTDSLGDLFPEFPAFGSGITVRHLLHHTSGLPDYETLIPDETSLQISDRNVLQMLMDADSAWFEPGSRYEYSNSGYAMLGLIIQKRSGQPLPDFFSSQIFQPLGMTQSVLYVRGVNEVPNRAFGHTLEGDTWTLTDQSLTSAVLGDGGVYSSLNDMSRWIAGLDNRAILTNRLYDQLYLSGRAGGTPTGYGFGWNVDLFKGQVRFSHTGSTRGFRSCLQRFPKLGSSVLVLLNGVADAPAICEALADVIVTVD